ncbi:MAG TPA: methyltransferase domain-containing protein [Candidatus Dormibacteraeota bacterium]|nr:methyltransferase domain-containing protein [Candidatus Dormibacteraeota bacterium]
MYTHGHHDSVLRSHRWRTAENSAAYLLPHLAPGMRLLDVGCGPGTITIDLAVRVSPGETIAIDTDAGVVAQAAEAARQAGSDVRFEVGDVYRLDAADGAFDVVHAHQVLQHLGDPVAALREMRRVCRPGGVVAARDADYAAMTWAPAEPALDRWLALYREIARRNGGQPDAGRHLLGWARRAGFAEVRPGASVWCFATPEDRGWWAETWAARVTESSLARQAVDHGLAATDELRELAAGWQRWAASPDGWFTVLHGEVVATAG